jgi:hypothetical protein
MQRERREAWLENEALEGAGGVSGASKSRDRRWI